MPINSRYTSPEAADIIRRAGCRAVFAEYGFVGRRLAAEAKAMAPGTLVIGMGAGQYLSDRESNLRKAIVMAVATLIGSVLPALPFFFGASFACVLTSVAITLAASAVIGHYRGYLVTY